MEKKYYVPAIEEFHVGFEFEVFQNDTWITTIFNQDEVVSIFARINSKTIISDKVRVKYLDQEDIESLGFSKRIKNNWVGWKDFKGEINNPKYEYFGKFTLHVPTMGDLYKIYVHRFLSEDPEIERESELVYKGLIKNKSELIKLLKQLNIMK